MKKRKQILLYIGFDFFTALLAWFLFLNFRIYYINAKLPVSGFFIENSVRYIASVIGIPTIWIILYAATGYYRDVFRKSRLKEIWQTFSISLIGNIVIFFVLILDDNVLSYKSYYMLFWGLLGFHFGLTWIARFIITHSTKKRIMTGKAGFNTLLIGSNGKAVDLYQSIKTNDEGYGYRFVGFIDTKNQDNPELSEYLKCLGKLDDLTKIIERFDIEEVIIAVESSQHEDIEVILSKLDTQKVITKVIPSLFDVLNGKVSMSFFLGTPLIIISHQPMQVWEINLKRAFDILFSVFAITAGMPLFIIAAVITKLSSKGAILYKQERIGRHEKPFIIYKFRTMYVNAEANGPQLSSANDPRITRFGKFMRKYRIDEIPQFFNVLKGDMSIVGPRPERRFYIDQILKHAPHYKQLFKVRPGITSWGAVKYGYTENLEQMLEQLKYDIFYVENMSLYLDFKILLYTIGVVLKREGK